MTLGGSSSRRTTWLPPTTSPPAVWRYGIRNGFGDTVQAQQILAAGEKRTADAQQALAALAEQVAQLRSAGIDDGAIRQALRDALDATQPHQ